MFLPLAVVVILFVTIFKAFVWDLVDDVEDCGDALVLRKGGVEQRILLKDIISFDYSPTSPPSASVWTKTEGPLGSPVTIRIPLTINPFSTPTYVTDLQERIYRAKRDAD